MLKKTIKVKGTNGRTSLVEFLVDKRVKYLEYIKDICTDEGDLWMNSIHLNATDVAHYFRTADAATACGAVVPTATTDVSSAKNTSFVDPNASFTTSGLSSAAVANARELHFPIDTSVVTNDSSLHLHASGDATPAGSSSAGGVVTVSLATLPVVPQVSSASDWSKRVLPSFATLALSLSDLLLAPITGEEFVECFYGLLLEVEAFFAAGAATKAMAQRAIKNYRQHLSNSLRESLQDQNATDLTVLVGGARPGKQGAEQDAFSACAGPSASGSPTSDPASPLGAATPGVDVTSAEGPFKYLFLRIDQLEYQTAPPACESILPALCAVLVVAFRKMCDYDLMSDDESVKRILSIDKHLQSLIFKRLNKEFERMARGRLVREAYLLSPSGLFAGIGESDMSFLQDVVDVMKTAPSPKKAKTASGAGDEDAEGVEDSEDSDD